MTGGNLKKNIFLGDIRHTEYGAYTTKYAVKDPSICSNPSVISEENRSKWKKV